MTTRPTSNGHQVVEVAPTHCPNGHALKRPNVQIGYLPCSCADGRGHRLWRCWTCGAVIYDPDHDEQVVTEQGRWLR